MHKASAFKLNFCIPAAHQTLMLGLFFWFFGFQNILDLT